MKIKLVIEDFEGERLDFAVASSLDGFSRSRVAGLIKGGFLSLNGERGIKASKTVKEGDVVEIDAQEPQILPLEPQDIPVDIVYQDEYLAVVNKPQGLTVHPANGIYKDTLVNALLFRFKDLSGINGVLRPGIVHRLDKDTSGLMVVAKCDAAHISLAAQIQSKECKRVYFALLEGVLKSDGGKIDKPLGRAAQDRTKMAIDPMGKNAVTHYTVLRRYAKNTLVRFELETGRTHQIRVHAKYLGFPVVGDKAYGFKNQRFKLDGQLLHSQSITFTHPRSNEIMTFTAPLPPYFERILSIVEKDQI